MLFTLLTSVLILKPSEKAFYAFYKYLLSLLKIFFTFSIKRLFKHSKYTFCAFVKCFLNLLKELLKPSKNVVFILYKKAVLLWKAFLIILKILWSLLKKFIWFIPYKKTIETYDLWKSFLSIIKLTFELLKKLFLFLIKRLFLFLINRLFYIHCVKAF